MAFGHAVIWRALPVSGVRQDVIRPDRPATAKSRFENGRIARHGKLLESAARRARERIERVGFAVCLDDIVKKCPELRMAQLDAGVSHHLDQSFKVKLGGDGDAGAIEHFQCARFLPHLCHTRFERFVERQKARFQRLAVGDLEDRATKDAVGRSGNVRPFAASQCRLPSGWRTLNSTCDPPFLLGLCESRMDLWNIIDEDQLFPVRKRVLALPRIDAEERGNLRSPIPVAALKIQLKRADAACRLRLAKRSSGPVRSFGVLKIVCRIGHARSRFSLLLQDFFGTRHRPELPKGNMPGQMIKSARACHHRLFGGKPPIGFDAVSHLLSGLHVRVLHIDGADGKLLVAEQAFVVMRHVVLDEKGVAIDPADEIRLVAARIEIAVADLAVIVRTDRVIALADMDHAH